MNQITIIGNLTGDPELSFSQSGTPWASFSVAVNYKDSAEFFRCKIFGDEAVNAGALTKGTRVIVVGRIQTTEWEKDGVKRTSTEVVVTEMGPSYRWASGTVERNERKEQEAF